MELNRFPGGLVVPQEWLDGIVTKLKATGVDIVKQTLLTVMQDFFRHTGAWRMWVGPVVVGGAAPPVPGRRVPVPPPDPKVAIRTIFEVKDASGFGLRRLGPAEYDLADERLLGAPYGWYQSSPGMLVLDQVPPPEAPSVNLGVYASLTPLDLCLPPAIQAEHYQALCDGTMAAMLRVKGPNFDLRNSAEYRRDYIRQRSLARWGAMTGYSIESTRVQAPVFAQGGSSRGRPSAWPH